MEQKLWSVSKDHYGKSVQSSTGSIQKLFNKRAKKFDGKFCHSSEKNRLMLDKMNFLCILKCPGICRHILGHSLEKKEIM